MFQMNPFRSVVVVSLMLLSGASFGQSDLSFGDKARRGKDMIEARHFFLNNNTQGALSAYRRIVTEYPDYAKAYMKCSEAAYELHRYDIAREYFEKGKSVDPNIVDKEETLLAGQIYHRLEMLDEAELWYKKYIDNAKGADAKLAKRYLAEVVRVREAQKAPLDVQFTWLGESVNSRYDDYSPILINNGNTLIFGTRRPQSTGSLIDMKGDHKYYEDIFFSTKEKGEWSQAKSIPGKVNTIYHDGVLGASEDGSLLYVYKNNDRVQGDIYFSKKGKNGEYGIPRRFEEINSSYYEGSVSFTSDGNKAYFISERRGGIGRGDIWVISKNGNDWDEPVNLGPVVNTAGDEKFVFIHPNGNSLVFASNGGEGFGDYDLYKTDIVNGEYTRPVNLGYPINSVGEESTFSLSQDFNTLFLSTERKDAMGERDIYSVDLSKVNLIDKPVASDPSLGVLKGAVVNVRGEGLANVEVSLKNIMGKVVQSVTTDLSGKFEFETRMDQPFELEAKPKGYLTKSEKVDFSEAEGGYMVKNLLVQKLAETIQE